MDVLKLFENLQKESQKALTTITDILMAKDILIRQLNMMNDNPYPGGEEEKLLGQRKGLLKKKKALEDLEDEEFTMLTCLHRDCSQVSGMRLPWHQLSS